MKKASFFLKVFISLLIMCQISMAKEFTAAVLYDRGGKNDKSFNESASRGVEKFKSEFHLPVLEFEITNETQREQALRKLAAKADVVAVIGFGYTSTLEQVAPDFPDTKFSIIDSFIDQPNIQSVLFKEHEGSFLVGMAAALSTKTGKIGFVGGMDIPLIRKFQLGYEEGARYVDPEIEIIANMTGSSPSAWSDPVKGAELAQSQIDRGVDVIYSPAGPTALGVYQAAVDKGIQTIGVDSNQNYLYPGNMLTSMVKSVDRAVYNAFVSAKNNSFKTGKNVMGLAEGGVSYAVDEHNKDLLSKNMKDSLEQAKQDIISGKLKVTDYTKTNTKKK